MRTLYLEIQMYLDDLHSSTDECQRPQADGEKCIQCREREQVIYRLESILRQQRPVDAMHVQTPFMLGKAIV